MHSSPMLCLSSRRRHTPLNASSPFVVFCTCSWKLSSSARSRFSGDVRFGSNAPAAPISAAVVMTPSAFSTLWIPAMGMKTRPRGIAFLTTTKSVPPCTGVSIVADHSFPGSSPYVTTRHVAGAAAATARAPPSSPHTTSAPPGRTRLTNPLKDSRTASSLGYTSTCSHSTFVTSATVGNSERKAPSYSSASSTKRLEEPWSAPPQSGNCGTSAPITAPRSSSKPSLSTMDSMAEVVVLPCVPATATSSLVAVSFPNQVSRLYNGMPLPIAASTSGFPSGTALETTTASTSSPKLSAECPTKTVAPAFLTASVRGPSAMSEPDTVQPCSKAT
mmetsp:Transcript_31631/g.69121  ORF Transcript_31631/g.69121 Transcript_31631/m.69121 type:complete len:332 (-) Transcript_31631:647-1642(-)